MSADTLPRLRELKQLPEVIDFIAAQLRFAEAMKQRDATAALQHLTTMRVEQRHVQRKLTEVRS